MLSISASRSPQDYFWFRLTEDLKPFPRVLKGYEDDFKKNKVLGLKLTKTRLYVMFPDLDKVTLNAKLYDRLIENVKPYRGKIDKKKVPAGQLDKPKVKRKTSKTRRSSDKGELFDSYIDAKIRQIKLVGSNLDESFVYLFSENGNFGETYHYYDISRLVNHYRRKHRIPVSQRANFDRDLKRALKKVIPFAIVESGLTNFEGKPISALSIVVEYASS